MTHQEVKSTGLSYHRATVHTSRTRNGYKSCNLPCSQTFKETELPPSLYGTPILQTGMEQERQHGPAVRVKNMSASWNYSSDTLVLANIAFELDQRFHLLAVVGIVGAGKVGKYYLFLLLTSVLQTSYTDMYLVV